MGIDDTAIRDLGLEQSPTSTELRLPARIGCVNGVGLGFVVLIVLRKHLVSAQSFQLQMLTSIEAFLATGDERHVNGPRGMSASADADVKELQPLEGLRDAYFKAHGMLPTDEAH